MKPGKEAPNKKYRHFVTWTPQEDDILREQIRIHGTESWTAIAGRFKDKTSRQCRRRWYTYLNSDCKKGGWSPEEDMILCEAQKIFGNRWTEIAKVVKGRTDNAVKNRFSTLCKKRAKHDAFSKENSGLYINPNNKRIILQSECIAAGTSESTPPTKKIRAHISDLSGNCNIKSIGGCGTEKQQLLRPPLAALVHNFNKESNCSTQQHVLNSDKKVSNDVTNFDQGKFLGKDDSKITELMQQAELLSSLALKVDADNVDESLEHALKELQGFFIESQGNELLRCKILEMDFLLEDFKDLVQDMKISNMGNRPSWRQPDLHEESQGSSEYSTGSTNQWHSTSELVGGHQAEGCSLKQYTEMGTHDNLREAEIINGCRDGFCCSASTAQASILPSCDELKDSNGISSGISNADFSSPLQTVPLFQPFGDGIPSPKFSDSERHFLLKTLGLASPTTADGSTNPSCKRALLHSL